MTDARREPNPELGWFDVRYELESLPGERTRLTQIDETHFQGSARLLQPLLWVAIQVGIRGQFKRLKELLETRATPSPARK